VGEAAAAINLDITMLVVAAPQEDFAQVPDFL
jgi:hypothetical protein